MPQSPHSRRTALLIPTIGFWGFILSATSLPAAPPVVTDLVVGPTTITLSFQDDGSSNQFTLQKTIGLDAANWGNANDATLTSLGGNEYTFAVPRTSADKQFYRILGSLITGTVLDPDGDGLASTLEASFTTDKTSPEYSDPDLFDTDGDGFSDGVEYAMDTEPNNSDSKPNTSTLPVVEFAASLSSAREGVGSHFIPLSISGNYSGQVFFTVNPRSTVKLAGADKDIEAISIGAGNGAIEVELVDDDNLSSERLLILDLSVNPAYQRGGRATHVVCISENDAYWEGTLKDGSSERNFRLLVKHSPGGTSACFVAGSADGTTAPDGVSGSQSEGIIPALPMNEWLATTAVNTASEFKVVSPAMPEGSTGVIQAGAKLQRILTLEASDDTLISANTIVGTYTDVVTSSKAATPAKPTPTYLDRTGTGTFQLFRALPTPASVSSEFQPDQP